jgi:hypothetical protein
MRIKVAACMEQKNQTCHKTQETDAYNFNVEHFRGFPFLPLNRNLTAVPGLNLH